MYIRKVPCGPNAVQRLAKYVGGFLGKLVFFHLTQSFTLSSLLYTALQYSQVRAPNQTVLQSPNRQRSDASKNPIQPGFLHEAGQNDAAAFQDGFQTRTCCIRFSAPLSCAASHPHLSQFRRRFPVLEHLDQAQAAINPDGQKLQMDNCV